MFPKTVKRMIKKSKLTYLNMIRWLLLVWLCYKWWYFYLVWQYRCIVGISNKQKYVSYLWIHLALKQNVELLECRNKTSKAHLNYLNYYGIMINGTINIMLWKNSFSKIFFAYSLLNYGILHYLNNANKHTTIITMFLYESKSKKDK